MNDSRHYPKDSAAAQGLASCHVCWHLNDQQLNHCQRCHTPLHVRTPNSLQLTLALLITSVLLYIPANVLPIMITDQFGSSTESTIIGGVLLFIDHHSYFVAAIIFIASIIIPIAKMLAILWLCYSVKHRQNLNYYELTRLYRITEFIGKWSMVDVFVVAILVALVQIGVLMSIKPGFAALAFASVVIFTMFAAHSFDSRLVWDKLESN